MKLSIEDPCHESWDAMTPNEQGSFCLSCQKTVIDFSSKSLSDIKSFFKELPLTEKVCGRFESRQLKELSFDDFFSRFKRWHIVHKLAVVCFFVFGLSLFSCTPGSEHLIGETDAHRGDTELVQKIPIDTPSVSQPPVMGQVALPPDTAKLKTPVRKKTVSEPDPKMMQEGVRPMLKGDVSVDPEPVLMKGKVSIRPEKAVNCLPQDTMVQMKLGEVKKD